MESEEIAALAAALGKAMAEGITSGMAANDDARSQKLQAERQEKAEAKQAEDSARKRKQALDNALLAAQRQQDYSKEIAQKAVASYCGKAQDKALGSLKKNTRLPRRINYLQRYKALMGMDDRSAVLKRLGETLDMADEIIVGAEKIDISAAFVDAASAYAQRVMLLDGIAVASAAPDEEDCEADALAAASAVAPAPAPAPAGSSSFADVSAAMQAAFAQAMGEVSQLEVQKAVQLDQQREREQAENNKINGAVQAARKVAAAMANERAQRVEGALFSVEQPAAFDSAATAKIVHDPAAVQALSAEVRKSFKTFKQVVADNGLFAAFANENSYGACGSPDYIYWDDYDDYWDEEPDRSQQVSISMGVKEARGGDTLEAATERMRTFNKQKYWGLLDDDFQQHVNAFWYGFKKLMESVNGMFRFSDSPFRKYCQDISNQLQNQASELGAYMNERQAQAFRGEVNARLKNK